MVDECDYCNHNDDGHDGKVFNPKLDGTHLPSQHLLHSANDNEEQQQDITKLDGEKTLSSATQHQTEANHSDSEDLDNIEAEPTPDDDRRYDTQTQHGGGGGGALLHQVQVRRVVMDRYDEETRSFEPRPTTALTIRKTNRKVKSLMVFLTTVCPFIMMDEWMLLPVGILLYSVALQCAWENWYDEMELTRLQQFEQRSVKEWLIQQRKRHRSLQQAVERAKFEVHILQNRPHVPIVPRQNPNDKSGRFEVVTL